MNLFKRNTFSAVFVMVLFSCIMSAPLFAQDEVTPGQQNITFDFSRKEPIKIVYARFMSPYTFEDDTGAAQGLAVDLLRLWSKKTGIPVQFSSATWNDGLQMMRDGKADIHASLYYNKERDPYLDYAAVVVSSKGGVFFHKSISNLKSPGDLKGFRVGVLSGSYHEQYIRKHLHEVVLVAYPEFPKMLDAAQKGDIRVFVDDVGTTLYRLQKRGLIDEFRYNPSLILYSNNFWIAVREGDKKLANALEEGMALVTPGERATLERKWLTVSTAKAKDTLFIAMYSDFSPYTFINAEGKPAGLFVDIWNLWAKKSSKRIEYIFGNWADSLNNLKTGRADIHSGLFHSDSRAQWLDYSKPFYETSAYLFFPSDQKEPTKKDFYAGGKIGTIKGSYHEEHLRKVHPKVEVVTFTSREKMLRSVLNREISACLTEYLSAKALISRLGLSGKFNSLESMHLTQEFHWGVLKDNPQLFALVKAGFDAITHNELLEIEQHWVLEPDKQYYRPLVKSIPFTEEEQVWIAENHTIRVTFSEAPPYFSFKGGKVHGIAVDFLHTISESTGVKFQFEKKPYRFAEELKGLKEHTGPDLVSAIMPTPEREKDILFTQLYIHSPRFIFTRDDAPFISSIENLFGQKVAVIKDYVTHRYLVDNYPDINLMVFATNEEALRAVSSGEAFAYIGDLISTPAVINEFGLKNLKAACPSGLPDHDQAMGIRNDWPELRDILSKALEAIPADEKAAIRNRWTTVRIEHGTRPGEVRKWILIIGGISIFVILVFIAWNRTLNRRVREKTATLAESELRFRATFEQAAVGIAHVSPKGEFRRVNKKFCDILGYSTEELVPKTFQETLYPEDLDIELKKMEQLIAGEIDVHSMDKRYIRKDGLPIWINSTVSLVRNEKGRPLWFMKVVEDISERKRMRAYRDMAYQVTQILGESGDLHELLQRVVAVMKTSTGVDAAGIRLQDGDDFPYFEQDGFSREFLAKEGSLQGRNQDGDICRDGNGEPILECTCGLVISGKTDPANPVFTRGGSAWTNDALSLLDVPAQDDPRTHPHNECIHKGYASVAVIPLRAGVQIVGLLQLNARREGVFILPEVEVLESIGEGIGTMVSRKRTEREITRGKLELAHMSRVSTMAELATSLAHELNQPLSAILSNAQAGLRFMEGGNPDLKELAEILADIVADDKRAGDIIQKLRAFLRNAPPELEMLDANIVVRDVLNILNSEVLIQGITITTELAAEMPRIRADQVQLQQVLINLVVNAEQAMAGQKDDEPTLHIKTSSTDGNVVVSLQDTGPGVPEEALERIFDPFYSTRNAGMGMGLAISRSIVTANGGQMWAENVSAAGARFCVMLLGESSS